MEIASRRVLASSRSKAGRPRISVRLRILTAILVPALAALAGCGGPSAMTGISNGEFTVYPGVAAIDTNCAGCNSGAGQQFSAAFTGGGAARVTWSVSGGDPTAGPGTISSTGRYTPPAYLTTDKAMVTVTAALASNPASKVSSTLTLTPGFLQPLTPENVALGSGASVIITGYVAEAGGSTDIRFTLNGQGTLGATSCARNGQAYTRCAVTYTAPAAISATSDTYIVASIDSSASRESTVILLNPEGVDSNPAGHQQQLDAPVYLGSSGGNNNDYDTRNGQIVDCCSGTLGALVQNSGGARFLLSNNHVLARSDQAGFGELIVQPGMIEDSCTPYGQPGAAISPVGALSGFVPIKSSQTNVDAAIAQVNTGSVSAGGSILELGSRQANGKLAAAPPGVSSTGGKGESAALNMTVAKSGRTTGLTCANVSAVALDVQVSYFTNCAETDAYYTKTFTGQIGIAGNQFSDAGDSGALVVDASNAEPVGLYFAGGVDAANVGQAVASPAGEVLGELGSYAGSGGGFTFVGGADHPVSCLNYGNATTGAAQARSLNSVELDRVEQAIAQARMLVNTSSGILGVATGKSSDRAGEAGIVVYVDPGLNPVVPVTINGVRTTVIPATARQVAAGAAPQSLAEAGVSIPLSATALGQAIAAKQRIARSLMKQNPAFFGVGVGQSLDSPKEAALVIYVDRNRVPSQLPATLGGLRTRYVIMERLHVTRAYLSPTPARNHCVPHAALVKSDPFGLLNLFR